MEKLLEHPLSSELANDPRWEALLRITQSDSLGKANRLCQFLIYIGERALTRRTDEITEQQIGVNVFNKSPTYNPSDDTIVRVTARQLRQRLAVYYQEEGHDAQVIVTIPRGGYIPVFEMRAGSQPAIEPITKDERPGMPEIVNPTLPITSNISGITAHSGKSVWLGIVMGLLLASIGYISKNVYKQSTGASHVLWTTLFSKDRDTLIVAGDAGLNIFANLARHEVELNEYISRSYLSSPFAQTPVGYTWDPLSTRTYTTVQDLRLSTRLVQLPNLNMGRVRLRYAREISMEDLKDSNAILLGAPMYDPWEQLFQKNTNFSMHYDGLTNSIAIDNKAPKKGEQLTYKWVPGGAVQRGFALITLTKNLNGDGRILMVQGTTASGNDAAGDFLMNDKSFMTFLSVDASRNGKLADFQIVLEITMTGGGGSVTRTIATRIDNR